MKMAVQRAKVMVDQDCIRQRCRREGGRGPIGDEEVATERTDTDTVGPKPKPPTALPPHLTMLPPHRDTHHIQTHCINHL
jgi:hypothetical protein